MIIVIRGVMLPVLPSEKEELCHLEQELRKLLAIWFERADDPIKVAEEFAEARTQEVLEQLSVNEIVDETILMAMLIAFVRRRTGQYTAH